MIKGVNKSIIEINDTGNDYFEKAILYIRPSHASFSQKRIEDEAKKYIENAKKSPIDYYFDLKEDRKRKKRLFLILGGYILALAAAIAALIIFL